MTRRMTSQRRVTVTWLKVIATKSTRNDKKQESDDDKQRERYRMREDADDPIESMMKGAFEKQSFLTINSCHFEVGSRLPVLVCVCVCEGEREREIVMMMSKKKKTPDAHQPTYWH
jgi:hypothetical protein